MYVENFIIVYLCKYLHSGYNFCKIKITEYIFFYCYIFLGALDGTMVFL